MECLCTVSSVKHEWFVCDGWLFQNECIICQFVNELCHFWEQAKSQEFTKKLDASRETGQDLDEQYVKTTLDFFIYAIIVYF